MAGDGNRLNVAVQSSATRWQANTTSWRRNVLSCWPWRKLTPDEIESQRKRRKANKRKVVSRYNEELPRYTETEVVTQDTDEETKADDPYSVRAKCPPLTEKEECKQGENRNTQVRYEEEQWNLIKIENWTQTIDASVIKYVTTSPNKKPYVTRRAETTREERIKVREINRRQQRASRTRRAVQLMENTTIM